MTNGEFPDPILRGASQLPLLIPNERRAAQLRARCHARLARRAPETRGFGPAAVAGFCLLYLSAVVHDVLRIRGMF